MAKSVRMSLANKCQLLFGAAVVLILTATLTVGWLRMRQLVLEGQAETARKAANAFLVGMIEPGVLTSVEQAAAAPSLEQGLTLARVEKQEFGLARERDPFLRKAIERFQTRNDRAELFEPATDDQGHTYYRYARAVRKSDLSRIGGPGSFASGIDAPTIADPLEAVLLIQLRGDLADRQLLLNRIYVVAAGLLGGFLAVAVFWFIINRIILSPVRVLRDTAEKVSEGDLNLRAVLTSGDEYEQLAEMLNHMLENLKKNQDQLRSINKSLDLKLGELAETNISLYEANKIKGEFLANVSHELRTPLNSIIGFAQVLQETLADQTGPIDEKRKRYAANIIASSKRLLDLITDLLDLAKIEAGRMEVRVGPMSISDTAEGLVNLMRPQAEARSIELRLKIEAGIPLVQTDAGKFQQVLFNFLSNAIKFTPAGGTVTLSAHLTPAPTAAAVAAADPAHASAAAPPGGAPAPAPALCLCTSVSDTGPGIPYDQQERIFEKFTQLGTTVTKEHGGTGLGLAISRELARLLLGEIRLQSEVGKGSTFSLIIPMVLEARIVPLMPGGGAGLVASGARAGNGN